MGKFIETRTMIAFVLGCLVGVMGLHFLTPKPQPASPFELKQPQAKTEKPIKVKQLYAVKNTLRSYEIAEPPKEEIQPPQETQAAPPKPVFSEAEVKKIPKKRQFYFSLSKEEVEVMEQSWSDLPRQVKMSAGATGWRVSWIAPNSLFSQAGLREGDLIRRDSLEQIAQAQDDEMLADRVGSILNWVSQ
jgi:hypothetical protein